jgi:hypothetical protein
LDFWQVFVREQVSSAFIIQRQGAKGKAEDTQRNGTNEKKVGEKKGMDYTTKTSKNMFKESEHTIINFFE